MFWKATQTSFSNDDDRLIRKVIKILGRKGERTASQKHIFGLKTWLSVNWEMVESFIFAVARLHVRYWRTLQELTKLKERAEKCFGTSEIVDLDDNFELSHFFGYGEVKGIILSKEHSEKLLKLIKKAAKDAEKHGFDEGSNLLVRMAKGDTSLTEFETRKNHD